MVNIEELVYTKIHSKKVMIFSKSFCPFCSKAKQAFRDFIGSVVSPDDYEVMELEDHPDGEKILDYLLKITGSRTVPRVFVNGKCIGGGDETVRLNDAGDLRRKLLM
ncbi:glutaredoxin-C4-like [Argonauta hians]